MGKTGWQVASGILALGLIGAGFALVANRTALAQANEDLKAARTIETVTVHEVHEGRCTGTNPAYQLPDNEVVPWPEGAKCLGGRLLNRTPNGWESVIHKGKPVICAP